MDGEDAVVVDFREKWGSEMKTEVWRGDEDGRHFDILKKCLRAWA